MKKALLAVAIASASVLAGCAGSPIGNLVYGERYETLNDLMQSWVGEPEEKLISKWGPPDNTYRLDNGSKVLSWEHVWGVYVGQRFYCSERFMIDPKGIVSKWGYTHCRKSVSNPKVISKDVPIPQPTL